MSAAEQADHVLTVRVDPAYPDDRDAYLYSITCPYDPDDMTRPCVTWWECRDHIGSTADELLDDGEDAPCDAAHPGLPIHRVIDGRVCHPSRECFPAQAECLPDAARDLQLSPGEHPVDYDVEDFSDMTLMLARSAS